MKKSILGTLETDELMYQDDLNSKHSYHSTLGARLQKAYTPVRDFMKQEFDINIVVQTSILHTESDPSLQKIVPLLEEMDPWTLNAMFVMTSVLKSTSLALYSLYDKALVDEVMNIS